MVKWIKNADKVFSWRYFSADILGLEVKLGEIASGSWQVTCRALNLPWTPVAGETAKERKVAALAMVRDALVERHKVDLARIKELVA
jgi:hypothetical protein